MIKRSHYFFALLLIISHALYSAETDDQYAVALSPDGTSAYVINSNENFITVVDTNTNEQIGIITSAALNQPIDITVTGDGKHAQVTNVNGNNVSIDLTTIQPMPKETLAENPDINADVDTNSTPEAVAFVDIDTPIPDDLHQDSLTMHAEKIAPLAKTPQPQKCDTHNTSYDVLIEAKGNCFITTNDRYQDIYGRATGGGGFEITAGQYKNIYGFLSVDAFHKSGHSIGFCDDTTATFVEIALGLKYFVPFRYGDFYIGLGVLPTYLRTKDCAPFVIEKQSKWGCGGIAKFGTYFDLPRSFILDIFLNYAFVKIPYECCFNGCTQNNPARLNGVIIGAGLGYRFN